MNTTTLAILASLTTLAAAAPAAAATNLIVNGGFETPLPPAASFTIFGGGSTALTGWQVLGPARNAVALLDNAYTEHSGVTVFEAQSGQASLDLSGGENTGPTAGVRQDVATEIGRLYSLSFWLGNQDGSRNNNYTLPSTLTLSINGASPVSFTNATETRDHVNWQLVTTSFRATSASTSIAFRNATPVADAFTGLDNVSLTAAPEPATWAMMIGGLGLAGAMLRRARRLAAA